MSYFKKNILLALCCTWGLMTACFAAPFENIAALRQTVTTHISAEITPLPGEKISVSVAQLGDHLQLAQCTTPLSLTDIPQENARYYRTVLVACSAPQPWKFYVTAQIQRFQKVLIAADTLMANQPITAASLKLATRETSVLHEGYFSDPTQLINTTTRYTIPEGQVITPDVIKQSTLVKRDEPIAIIAITGGIKIQVNGKAEQDGTLGQTIQVRNLSTNKTVFAKVTGAGEATVE